MTKQNRVGIDVGAKTLVVAVDQDGRIQSGLEYENTAAGHRKLISKITKQGRTARVVLEATGIYGLDLALALDAAPRIEVMVANPRTTKKFADAILQRSKTDPLDALSLLEYVRRMPFLRWSSPPPEVLALRSISRRMEALTAMRTQEKNRLHATSASEALPEVVRCDIEETIGQLGERIETLQTEALRLIGSHPKLNSALDHVTSIRGIANTSAIAILSELLILPPEMGVRQWVAHAGLDPRERQSGTSLRKPARISRAGNQHLRRALFMPALVAVQWEPEIKAFYEHLLDRGKTKMQANVAVMRKLLHCIYGMLRHDQDFIGEKFYAART